MPRKTYTVTFPDGHEQSFDGPVGMSQLDAINRAKQERQFSGGEIPTSFAGGATRHLLEDEPQTVNALLGGAASATGVGALGMAAVPAVSRGLKGLSQLLATGRADVPTPREVGGLAAEGAFMGYAPQGVAAGARKLSGAKDAVVEAAQALPSWLRGPLRASGKLSLLDAATSKPVLGAVEQLGEGLSPGRAREAFSSVLDGLTPGVEDAPRPSAGFLQSKARANISPSMRALQDASQAAEPNLRVPAWPESVPDPGRSWSEYTGKLGQQAEAARPVNVPRPAGAQFGTGGPGFEDVPSFAKPSAAAEAGEAVPDLEGLGDVETPPTAGKSPAQLRNEEALSARQGILNRPAAAQTPEDAALMEQLMQSPAFQKLLQATRK